MLLANLLDTFVSHPRRLFLVDGLGAVVTAAFGVAVAQLEETFGMPPDAMYVLSALGCVFAIYSLTCSFSNPRDWQPYLRVIAIANVAFCCITAGLVVYFHERLTSLGFAYFAVEWLVIGAVVWVELRTISISLSKSR